MKWLDKLERKIGKYAVKNLSLALIICYCVGYLIQLFNSGFLSYLTLDPYAIAHGQVWRLVTWIIMPPESSNFFFVLIMLLFYFSIGTALERTWGTWKYNVYIFGGMLCTIIGAFVMMAWGYLFDAAMIREMTPQVYFRAASYAFSTYYINMSIFLAYAVTFPDMVVLLFFFIPLKVKWLGIVYAVMLVWELITAPSYVVRIAIIASLANFLILFLSRTNWRRFSPSSMKRQSDWRRAAENRKRNQEFHTWNRGSDGWMRSGNGGNANGSGTAQGGNSGAGNSSAAGDRKPLHRCAVCGRTDVTNPELEFRYCSKCDGEYEYCEDHIRTHMHVHAGDRSAFDANGNVRIDPEK